MMLKSPLCWSSSLSSWCMLSGLIGMWWSAACLLVHPVGGTVYVNSRQYPSLPALFGASLKEGETYHARLQFLWDNPLLCDDNPITSFVAPPAAANSETTSASSIGSGDEENISSTSGSEKIVLQPNEGDAVSYNVHFHQGAGHGNDETIDENNRWLSSPIVLLAARGGCSFEQKARVAESIHPSVQFLLVYNFEADGTSPGANAGLVPMYAESSSTRLALLSVTYRAGMVLRNYVESAATEEAALGGPWIQFDSQAPANYYMQYDELQQMLISALGLFAVMLALTGCFVFMVGVRHDNTTGQFYFVLGGAGVNGVGGSGGSSRLLTEQQVRQLPQIPPKQVQQQEQQNSSTAVPSASGSSTTSDPHGSEQDPDTHCAICFDPLDDGSDGGSGVTKLPCGHLFHTDCLVPWLTQRNSLCPLCKFDVYQAIVKKGGDQQQEDPSNDPTATMNQRASTATLFVSHVWNRVMRYHRWQHVQQQDDDETNSNNNSNNNNTDNNTGNGSDGSRENIIGLTAGTEGSDEIMMVTTTTARASNNNEALSSVTTTTTTET